MNRQTFKRQQRLLNAADYSGVFNQVDIKISHPAYLLLARRVPEASSARLGLIAAKKHLKRAVQRNHFKRHARESFRLNQHSLPGIDLILMARSGAAQASSEELRAAFDQAWPRLCKRLASLPPPTAVPASGGEGPPSC